MVNNALTKKGSKFKISASNKKKLEAYAEEIKALVRQTVMSAIRIGEILLDVRTNLLPGTEWEKWVDNEFSGDIHHDSANNFINAYKLYKEYGDQYDEGIKKLPLGSLYVLVRTTTEPEVKEAILQLAKEEEPMSKAEVNTVIQTYRKLRLKETGLSEQSIEGLEELEIAEDPKEIKVLSRLSSKKKEAVAGLLASGEVDSTRMALRKLKEINQLEESENNENKVIVEYTEIIKETYKNLQAVPSDCVDLAIIEAPFKTSYVNQELPSVSLELDRILKPGGYLIHFLGHKAIMYAGDALAPLCPLHVICLRKTPGKTRYIIGSNIASASVLAAFAYKPPYRSPKQLLVDLQTITEIEGQPSLTNTEAVDSFDDVPTGIEEGIERMMMPLINNESTVLHAILSNSAHFNIKDHIVEASKKYKCEKVISVHEK